MNALFRLSTYSLSHSHRSFWFSRTLLSPSTLLPSAVSANNKEICLVLPFNSTHMCVHNIKYIIPATAKSDMEHMEHKWHISHLIVSMVTATEQPVETQVRLSDPKWSFGSWHHVYHWICDKFYSHFLGFFFSYFSLVRPIFWFPRNFNQIFIWSVLEKV